MADARQSPPNSNVTSRVDTLKGRIENDRFDLEAHLALIKWYETQGDLEGVREAYEGAIKSYPGQILNYATLELAHNNFDKIEALFTRFLRASVSLLFWRFYLDFIRRINPLTGDDNKTQRQAISAAYEFALSHVGTSRYAGSIWKDYVDFLKTGGGATTWEAQQREDALRAAYKRAVCLPLENVETLWQEYNQFENGLSKIAAKKFISELSPAYMAARRVLKELRARFDRLGAPTSEMPHRPDWSRPADVAAMARWRDYIAYERANPLGLEAPDVQARVILAFKSAGQHLQFYPEHYLTFSHYYTEHQSRDEALAVLQSGMEFNPGSTVLTYALSDALEGKGEFSTCHELYSALIEHIHGKIAKLEEKIEREIRIGLEDLGGGGDGEARENAEDGEGRENTEDEPTEGTEPPPDAKTIQEKEELKQRIRAQHSAEISALKLSAANVWISEMRFARRAEGVKPARIVFGKARKSPYATWHIYDASAMMELHSNQEKKISNNVYEFGMKFFFKEPAYVLRYLKYLVLQSDVGNARALFEKSANAIEPADARDLYDFMLSYEYAYGDFHLLHSHIARYRAAFPEVSETELFVRLNDGDGLGNGIAADFGPGLSALADYPALRDAASLDASGKHPREENGDSVASSGANTAGAAGVKRLRPGTTSDAKPDVRPAVVPPRFPGRGVPIPPRHVEPPPDLFLVAPGVSASVPEAVVSFIGQLPPSQTFSAHSGVPVTPALITEILMGTRLPTSAGGVTTRSNPPVVPPSALSRGGNKRGGRRVRF